MADTGRPRRWLAGTLVGLSAVSFSLALASAQETPDWSYWASSNWRGWWNRVPPRFPDPEDLRDRAFSFCRV
ncbi:MAG: hypothetical protein ACRD1X_13895, partial [Vicinamibacteria bacterium]